MAPKNWIVQSTVELIVTFALPDFVSVGILYLIGSQWMTMDRELWIDIDIDVSKQTYILPM